MPPLPPFLDHLSLSDYGYGLPDERIARFPLQRREDAKLLVWRNGIIRESRYSEIAGFLPDHSMLVFNNSRVIEARLLFQKPSGGQIEIFCLEPHPEYPDISKAMSKTGSVQWICLIGGASKWKRGQILIKETHGTRLEARFIEKRSEDFVVEFSWSPAELSFASVLHQQGSVPLPPYLKRVAVESDAERYQTVYARESGSVAAPTAGLHFSKELLQSLESKKIRSLYLTLHVGAGTFMPVKTDRIADHHMHEEFIEVDAATVEKLIAALQDPVVAVGTTSLRTLETLYWLGYQISRDRNISAHALHLEQWYPYRQSAVIPASEALQILLEWIKHQPEEKLITKTQLFIVPGYNFRVVKGLITNFHQPHSTLLMLVAAFIGPSWKSAYTFALDNDFRFLSYGDGCLFLR
jgi:S-adenosylmethionine:tRNA ribosyltransferase-isomerase